MKKKTLGSRFSLRLMQFVLGLWLTMVTCAVVTPASVFGADKLVVKNAGGTTTFKVEDDGKISNVASLLANGAGTAGSAPMVLGQNPSNRGIVITDKAESNKKNIYIGWNAFGGSFEYMEILAVHEGVAFKNIIFASGGGNVGIGTTSPSYRLDVNGYVNATGYVQSSSREYKKDIGELTGDEAMAALNGLSPVKFRFKKSPEERHLGFIAEDAPDLVATKDRKGMSSMDVVAVLTKVVQEQQKVVQKQLKIAQEQQKTINELSRKVASLENRVK